MQILVIGKSQTAVDFAESLSKNKNNIVFITQSGTQANDACVNPLDVEEVKDFAIANEIGLSIVADSELFKHDYFESFEQDGLKILAPDMNSKKIILNRVSSLKFAYKNKIPTPVFSTFEKPQAAIDYLLECKFPLIICSDKKDNEKYYIAETKSKAKKYIQELFDRGTKKITTLEYIFGKDYNIWLLLNENGSLNLLETVSYFDEISTNNVGYINNSALNTIKNEYIPVLLDSLIEEECCFNGILGLHFTTDFKNNIYFKEFSPFFGELDLNIFLNTNEDISTCFTQNRKTDSNKYSISLREGNEIINSTSNTLGLMYKILENQTDNPNIKEARTIWQK